MTETRVLASKQRMRLQRLLLGHTAYAATFALVFCLTWIGALQWRDLAVYSCLLVISASGLVLMIRLGVNLRFKDPSLTAAAILIPSIPAAWVLFQLDDAVHRAPLLFMGVVGLLFGAFVNRPKTMAGIAGVLAVYYAVTILALLQLAPERIHLREEIMLFIAYAITQAQIVLVSVYIAGLRRRLVSKNKDLKQASRRLEELATRDALTGLPNRRACFDQLDYERSRTRALVTSHACKSLCIALLDVDHFKQINDRFGHATGDEALIRISHAVRETLRKQDFFGRYGGEEFVLMLPMTPPNQAQEILDRAREAISRIQLCHDDVPVRLAASLGAAIHTPGESIEKTLARADTALYEAKRIGRNQVCLAPEYLPHAQAVSA